MAVRLSTQIAAHGHHLSVVNRREIDWKQLKQNRHRHEHCSATASYSVSTRLCGIDSAHRGKHTASVTLAFPLNQILAAIQTQSYTISPDQSINLLHMDTLDLCYLKLGMYLHSYAMHQPIRTPIMMLCLVDRLDSKPPKPSRGSIMEWTRLEVNIYASEA